MSRIVVEYNPPLSKVVEKIIRNEVTASMVSNDETSCQYDISMVEQLINLEKKEYITLNFKNN